MNPSLQYLPARLPDVQKKLFSSKEEYDKAVVLYKANEKLIDSFDSFDSTLDSVEIMWEGIGLIRTYFKSPRESLYLSEETIEMLKDEIDYSDDDKVSYFVKKVSGIKDDLELKLNLDENYYLGNVSMIQYALKSAICFIAIFVNFILVISLKLSVDGVPEFSSSGFHTFAFALIIMQAILNVVGFILTASLRIPLIYKESSRNFAALLSNKSIISKTAWAKDFFSCFAIFLFVSFVSIIVDISLFYRYGKCPSQIVYITIVLSFLYFLNSIQKFSQTHSVVVHRKLCWWLIFLPNIYCDSRMLLSVFYTTISLLCLDTSKAYLNSLMLLVIINMSETLKNVVKAVTIPAISLMLSSLLGMVCIFIFAFFAFYYFSAEFYDQNQLVNECETLLFCLATFIHGGLLNGGGIADHIGGFKI